MANKRYSPTRNDIIAKDREAAIIRLNTYPVQSGIPIIIKYFSDPDKTRVDILFAIGIHDGIGPETYRIISDKGILLVTEIVQELPDVSQLVHGQKLEPSSGQVWMYGQISVSVDYNGSSNPRVGLFNVLVNNSTYEVSVTQTAWTG